MWSDPGTTFADMRRAIASFVDERDWRRYHTPVNVASAAAVEAAELLEHFQWRRRRDPLPDDVREAAAEELADVLHYALAAANAAAVDLAMDEWTVERTAAMVNDRGQTMALLARHMAPKDAAEAVLVSAAAALAAARAGAPPDRPPGLEGVPGSLTGEGTDVGIELEVLVGNVIVCARTLGVDLARELERKMARNRERFPAGSGPDVGY
jgi:NTP pyrophosphatase (non-canonical NTP hydrolase)